MMPRYPDFNDPRYLNEVGWFLYREKHGYNHWTNSYAEERLAWSPMLLEEVLSACGQDRKWIEDKTVVSIGSGCTGDLAAWPAALKIAIDPLFYTYHHLDMLIKDAPGTNRTLYLSTGVEDIPLLDDSADLVLCRNALDHMPDPKTALAQIWRILRKDGVFFLSVDVGGSPTPDEPSPFTTESLLALLQDQSEVLSQSDHLKPHNEHRDHSVRILARKRCRAAPRLNKEAILKAYETLIDYDRQCGQQTT